MLKSIKDKRRLCMGLKNAQADVYLANFIFYYGPTSADCDIFELDDFKSILEHTHFDTKKKSVLYLHGYLEGPDVESINVIVNAYLQRDDTNFFIVDWEDLANGNYAFDAVVNAKQLGSILAKTLFKMFDIGLDIEQFHIVGHSLGGQMAGIIGREIHKLSNKTKKIKRISALDPAFPLFYFCCAAHLSKHDGEFVDVIHTDAWFYGAPISTGTVDFWPNSGKTLQPGCPKRNYRMLSDNDLSSHRRSWWFWAESVSSKHIEKFDSIKAKNWKHFRNGKFIKSSDQYALMGHDCASNITGNYFLQTNGSSPFARGLSGTSYVNSKALNENDFF